MYDKNFIAQIAVTDPRSACLLARGNAVLQSYRIQVEFNDTITQGTLASAFLDAPLGEDFFVTDVRSTINRPLAFAGSIFKAQADVNNAMNPGLDVKLTVQGGNPGAAYVINQNFTPIELIAPPIASSTASPILCNFTLTASQTVKGEFSWRRVLATDENPTIVTIIFKGWTFGCSMYAGLNIMQAREMLKKEFGILCACWTPLRGR